MLVRAVGLLANVFLAGVAALSTGSTPVSRDTCKDIPRHLTRPQSMWNGWTDTDFSGAFPKQVYRRPEAVSGALHYMFLPMGDVYLDETRAGCLVKGKARKASPSSPSSTAPPSKFEPTLASKPTYEEVLIDTEAALSASDPGDATKVGDEDMFGPVAAETKGPVNAFGKATKDETVAERAVQEDTLTDGEGKDSDFENGKASIPAGFHSGVVDALGMGLMISKEERKTLNFLVSMPNASGLLEGMKSNMPKDRVAEFENVWFDDFGCIGSPDLCRFAINGGCYHGFGACSTEVKTLARAQGPDSTYDLVIGLNSRFHGFWNTLMETLPALAHMNTNGAVIHVKKDETTTELLALLGIGEERIVEGPVFAKKLIVPEKAKCGSPSVDQVLWLRRFLRDPQAKPDTVILMRQRASRRNIEDVADLASGYAISKGMNFYHHNEKESWKKQFEAFSRARIIIAPRGPSALLMAAAAPGAVYIEYDTECSYDFSYMRIALTLGFNYYGMRFSGWGETIDVDKLAKVLDVI